MLKSCRKMRGGVLAHRTLKSKTFPKGWRLSSHLSIQNGFRKAWRIKINDDHMNTIQLTPDEKTRIVASYVQVFACYLLQVKAFAFSALLPNFWLCAEVGRLPCLQGRWIDSSFLLHYQCSAAKLHDKCSMLVYLSLPLCFDKHKRRKWVGESANSDGYLVGWEMQQRVHKLRCPPNTTYV